MADEDDVVKGGPDDSTQGGDKGATDKSSKEAGSKMVDLGGVQVPAEMAAYLEPLVNGFSSEISKLKGELAEAKASKGKTKTEDVAEEFDYETELFANPKAAIARLKEELRKEITGEVDLKQNIIETEKQFWKMFYTDHPELKDDDFIVKAVLNRDFQKLAPLTNEEAMKLIAAETKKVLLKNRGKPDGKSKGVELEGGSGGGAKGGTFEDVVKPAQVSITQLLKERRMSRVKTG